MGFKRIIPETQRQKNKDKKTVKNTHKAQSWALLNQADKNTIIGDWLISQGVVVA